MEHHLLPNKNGKDHTRLFLFLQVSNVNTVLHLQHFRLAQKLTVQESHRYPSSAKNKSQVTICSMIDRYIHIMSNTHQL